MSRGRRPRRKTKKSKKQENEAEMQEKKLFGEYRCPKCSRYWASAHSWRNYGQECNKCTIMVYAFKQRPLRRRKNQSDDNRKPHQEHLCEKCTALGYSCTGVL